MSDAFWGKITQNDQLTAQQTPIRVREDDPMARPVLVDDAPGPSWLVRAALPGGLFMMVVGAAGIWWFETHGRLRPAPTEEGSAGSEPVEASDAGAGKR